MNKKPPMGLVQAAGADSPQARLAKLDKAAAKALPAKPPTARPAPKPITKHPAAGVKHAPPAATPHGKNMARAVRAMQARRSSR